VTFRPEFHSQWGSEPHISTLILNRLGAQHTCEFVQRVAGGKTLPTAIVDQIVRRTDGVPLFIEELTRTVLESGVLNEQDDRYCSRDRFLRWPSRRACKRHCWLAWIVSLQLEK